MRLTAMCTFALAIASAAGAHAEPAKSDCAKPALRKARAAANKAVGDKDYKKAIALLEPLVRDCRKDPVESGWLAGDLAVAYDKNGQFVECQRLMAPLSHPKSAIQAAGNQKLIKAIEYNLDRCSKAFDAQYAALKTGGCSLTIDRSIAAAAAPAAMVPKGATAACVALVRGKRPANADDDPDSPDVVCPRVALVWKGAKATLERQDLTAGDNDALSDDSFCCNLSSIAAGTAAGKTLIRVRGQGRECSGGTSDSAIDVIYQWNATALSPSIDASVVFH